WAGVLSSVFILESLYRGMLFIIRMTPPDKDKTFAWTDLVRPPLDQLSVCAGMILLFIVILSLVRFTWNKLDKHDLAQLSLIAMAALAGLVSAGMAGLVFTHMPWMLPAQFSTAFFILSSVLPRSPDFILLLPVYARLANGAVALTMSLVLGMLLLRRAYEDLGRDYYNFAIRQGAWWILAGSGMAAICAVILPFIPQYALTKSIAADDTGIWISSLLYAACALFCCYLLRVATPLRHKIGIWLSLPCLGLALIGRFF
ncbi:MAG: hypothetical protein FWF99_06060, partial [Desulfovibrionaceae bacterium]|nr:hypothetical protein [Desulfovibrionaceae bacterium]